MKNEELLTKVQQINNDAKVRRISEQIEAKEAEIEKLKSEITDLKVKKIGLLQKDQRYYQGFSLIDNVMINHFKIKI